MSMQKESSLLDPWIATASTPFRSRYSCMSDEERQFELLDEQDKMTDVPSTSFLLSLKIMTGGSVFWRHSRRYTIFASCFTYSTT